MPKILQKLRTFRFSESSNELLEKAKKNYIPLSRFVRDAVKEKFERDFPKWIDEQKRKESIQCPF